MLTTVSLQPTEYSRYIVTEISTSDPRSTYFTLKYIYRARNNQLTKGVVNISYAAKRVSSVPFPLARSYSNRSLITDQSVLVFVYHTYTHKSTHGNKIQVLTTELCSKVVSAPVPLSPYITFPISGKDKIRIYPTTTVFVNLFRTHAQFKG